MLCDRMGSYMNAELSKDETHMENINVASMYEHIHTKEWADAKASLDAAVDNECQRKFEDYLVERVKCESLCSVYQVQCTV